MVRPMTPEEISELENNRIRVGAVDRNAAVCKCGHIDYFPNSQHMKNCVMVVEECIECK